MKASYPKWKYHATKPPVIVQTKEHEDQLGKGWAESPTDHTEVEAATELKTKKETNQTEGADSADSIMSDLMSETDETNEISIEYPEPKTPIKTKGKNKAQKPSEAVTQSSDSSH